MNGKLSYRDVMFLSYKMWKSNRPHPVMKTMPKAKKGRPVWETNLFGTFTGKFKRASQEEIDARKEIIMAERRSND